MSRLTPTTGRAGTNSRAGCVNAVMTLWPNVPSAAASAKWRSPRSTLKQKGRLTVAFTFVRVMLVHDSRTLLLRNRLILHNETLPHCHSEQAGATRRRERNPEDDCTIMPIQGISTIQVALVILCGVGAHATAELKDLCILQLSEGT